MKIGVLLDDLMMASGLKRNAWAQQDGSSLYLGRILTDEDWSFTWRLDDGFWTEKKCLGFAGWFLTLAGQEIN